MKLSLILISTRHFDFFPPENKVTTLVSGQNKKYIISLSSAELSGVWWLTRIWQNVWENSDSSQHLNIFIEIKFIYSLKNANHHYSRRHFD